MSSFDPQTAGGYFAAVAATIASAFAGWRMLRNQNSGDNVTRASNEANITAISTYKELVETERAARIAAELRADKFAEERNEAWKELYSLKGKLDVMSQQIADQSSEITSLREEVRQLKGDPP